MSIEIPAGLQWLADVAGSTWPKGDEDILFALSGDWTIAADALQDVLNPLRAACDSALANYIGGGADQMKGQFRLFFTGDSSVPAMVQDLRYTAESVYNAGTQTEYAKLQIVITLAIMAAEIAYALATLFGVWAVSAIEAEGAGVMRLIASRLAEHLAARATRIAEKPLWKLAAIESVKQGAIGFGADALAQGIQIGKGHRHGFDLAQAVESGASAMISAGVATPVGHVLGKQIGGWVGHDNMTWWKAGGFAVAVGIPTGLVGALSGFVANGILTGTWEFDPIMLMGGLGGGVVGGIHGALQHFRGEGMTIRFGSCPGEKLHLHPDDGSLSHPGARTGSGIRNDIGSDGGSGLEKSANNPGIRPAIAPTAGTHYRLQSPESVQQANTTEAGRHSPAYEQLMRRVAWQAGQRPDVEDQADTPENLNLHQDPTVAEFADTEDRLNVCGPVAICSLAAVTGSTVVHVPTRPVGRSGMSAHEFENAGGAPLQRFEDHTSIAEFLRYLGPGSAALVVDTYHGPADRYGVGAHAYVMRNKDGDLTVLPADGPERPLSSTTMDVRSVHAILYSPGGRPYELPIDPHTTGAANFGDARIGNTGSALEPVDIGFRIGPARSGVGDGRIGQGKNAVEPDDAPHMEDAPVTRASRNVRAVPEREGMSSESDTSSEEYTSSENDISSESDTAPLTRAGSTARATRNPDGTPYKGVAPPGGVRRVDRPDAEEAPETVGAGRNPRESNVTSAAESASVVGGSRGPAVSNRPESHRHVSATPEVRRGAQHDAGDQPPRPPDDPPPPDEPPPGHVPGIAASPPDDLSATVRDFGTRRDGAVDLIHLTPVPQETVEWLHEQVFAMVERGGHADEAFRSAVRQALTARLLSGEWTRLLSASGMPVRVEYRGTMYPVSLRLSLRAVGPSEQQIEPLPDGPPVGVQRWTYGTTETSDASGSSNLRSGGYSFAHTWPANHGLSFTPEIDLTHNQLGTGVSVASSVQSLAIIRSTGRSRPFDYEMNWELRPGGSLAELLSPERPSTGWRAATGIAPDKLVAWFPDYLARPGELPRIDPDDPATVPAPIERLRDEVPLYCPLSIENHDQLIADVMASFRTDLKDLSEGAGEQLREFLSEGNVRSILPLTWKGSADSPMLYTSSGTAIGYLRLTADLHGGTQISGPTIDKSAMDLYVARGLSAQGSSTVTNSLGGSASLGFGFAGKSADPITGIHSRGGQVTVKGGVSHSYGHTLNYGGNAHMSHSLHTTDPLLHITPKMRVHVTLVRPDARPVEPAAETPMASGREYPVHMLVPSQRTLGHAPTETRYLPPEIAHLRQLGVSATPLRVEGAEPLFAQARQWLSDHGFLPPDHDTPGRWDKTTHEATRVQRLNNVRKFDQMSNRLGLRGELDEMIDGGTTTWFELPTPTGTRRVSITLTAERRYGQDQDPYEGTSHDWSFPDIRTLNYVGSSMAGAEQSTETPLAWNFGGNGSITNPFDSKKTLRLQGMTPDYTRTGQSSTTRGSSSGTGLEHIVVSPTEDGTQAFTVPVRYRMRITYSHGKDPAPTTGDGSVRLAVPTFRTLPDKPADPHPPAPATIRDLTDHDIQSLGLPSAGSATEHGVLRLPASALLDRVGGSKELRKTALDLIDDIESEAARAARIGPAIPGSFPPDPQEADTGREDSGVDPAIRQREGEPIYRTDPPTSDTRLPHPDEFELSNLDSDIEPSHYGRTSHTPAIGITDPSEAIHHDEQVAANPPMPGAFPSDEPVIDGESHPATAWDDIGAAVMGKAHWVVDRVTGVGRWIWRNAVGEPATNPESMAHEVIHTALSPQHVNANALRIFRDSHVIEGANTPGTLAGTDVTLEVTGYLDNVKVLTQPPKMDAFRWLNSAAAASHTQYRQRGHQGGATFAGTSGSAPGHSWNPAGAYHYNSSTTKGSAASDNVGVFRITSENTAPMYRFTAAAHYVVNVRIGSRNVATGVLGGALRGDRTRVIDIPDAVEFLVTENDLQNHPDLLAVLRADDAVTGRNHQVPRANPLDRPLPTSYIASGGLLGPGTITDVEVEGGRKALQDMTLRLVQDHAPGATDPSSANYHPGVRTRINEHTTTLGLRTLPNAGPDGHTTFHFVDRSSWSGPRLVQVAFSARPRPQADLNAVRGKRVTTTSGLDNIFGHSTGDGAALRVPGATSVSAVRRRGHQLDFAPGGQFNGHRAKFDIGVQRQSALSEIQNSNREIRTWQLNIGGTSEFPVPYQYTVEVSSRPLDEALLTYLIRRGIAGIALSGRAFTGLTRADLERFARPMKVSRDARIARTLIRFNTSETPPGDTLVTRTAPGIYRSDPAVPRRAPADGDVAVEMELPGQLRELLAGPSWVPSRPIEIYDFGGAGQLSRALRLVDPTLDRQSATGHSAEGMLIRLTRLAAGNRLTLLGPAATAPFLGAVPERMDTGIPLPGEHRRGAPTSVRFTLYSPRIEKTSRDIAIDHVEVSSDGFYTQQDNTLATTATLGLNSRYSADATNSGPFTVPVIGEHANFGQSASVTSQRHEYLSFGTPTEGADGAGTTGHRVRAVGVLEVRGPKGVLWVVGDLLFRTTETPPDTASPQER